MIAQLADKPEKKINPKDPRFPGLELDRPRLRRLNLTHSGVPMVKAQDFLPEPIRSFPSLLKPYVIYRKLRKRFHKHVLKRSGMVCDAFGIPVHVPLDLHGIGHTIASYGYRELDQIYMLQQIIKPGMAVLEAGANIGFHIPLYAALAAGNLRIWAVEPDIRNIEALRNNITLSKMQGRVVVNNFALSDTSGDSQLYQAYATNLSALAPSSFDVRYDAVVKCTTRDFAEYLCQLPVPINLVRMDIEGHETNLLRSLLRIAHGAHKSWLPQGILFECHQWAYASQGFPNAMLSILEGIFDAGYSARYVATAHEDFSPFRSSGLLPEIVIHNGSRRCHGIYTNLPRELAITSIATEPSITRVYLHRNLIQQATGE